MQSKKYTPPKKSLPDNFNSLDEFWQFWDTHSSADYEDIMEPVEVEIDLHTSKRYCAIEKEFINNPG